MSEHENEVNEAIALIRDAYDPGLTTRVHMAGMVLADEVDRLRDDPAMDCTDGAHPAYWRGSDDGVRGTLRRWGASLGLSCDGVETGAAFGMCEAEVVRLRGEEDLNSDCIALMRGHLAEVGIEATFADDAAASAAGEIKRLRADLSELRAVVRDLLHVETVMTAERWDATCNRLADLVGVPRVD